MNKCDGKNHSLIEIYRRRDPDDIFDIVRWCEYCGAIVIDGEMDGRVKPGGIMKMRFPKNLCLQTSKTNQ